MRPHASSLNDQRIRFFGPPGQRTATSCIMPTTGQTTSELPRSLVSRDTWFDLLASANWHQLEPMPPSRDHSAQLRRRLSFPERELGKEFSTLLYDFIRSAAPCNGSSFDEFLESAARLKNFPSTL
jgi:hypothetical protein